MRRLRMRVTAGVQSEIDKQILRLLRTGVHVAFFELYKPSVRVFVPETIEAWGRWITYRRPAALRGELWALRALAGAVHAAEETRLEHEHYRAIIIGEMS